MHTHTQIRADERASREGKAKSAFAAIKAEKAKIEAEKKALKAEIAKVTVIQYMYLHVRKPCAKHTHKHAHILTHTRKDGGPGSRG